MTEYRAFKVELTDNIAHVQINRPEKLNAMNGDFWKEIIDIFQWIDDTDAVRVVVLSAAGQHFSAGIDLALLAQLAGQMGRTWAAMRACFGAPSWACRPRSMPWTTAANRCWRRSRATAWAVRSTGLGL